MEHVGDVELGRVLGGRLDLRQLRRTRYVRVARLLRLQMSHVFHVLGVDAVRHRTHLSVTRISVMYSQPACLTAIREITSDTRSPGKGDIPFTPAKASW